MAQTAPRSAYMKAPHTPPPVSRRAPRTDILDLRDLNEVIAAPSPTGSIVCIAGCDGNARPMAAAPSKPDVGVLALVGPIESAAGLKPVSLPVTADASASADTGGVVVCLAGCDDSDRKVMRATGAPLPGPLPRSVSPPRPVTAEATQAKAATLAGPQGGTATLKRSLAPHAKATGAKSHRSHAKATAPRARSNAPVTASASGRRPVRVETSGAWFNTINRAHAARRTDVITH